MQHNKEERELEQQILNLADLLIENLIATSMLTGEKQEQQLEVSTEIVAKIAGLLEQYLGDFNEHFETLLLQLTQQKLPNENVLSSFGDFNLLLEQTIKKGLSCYQTGQENPDKYNEIERTKENIALDATDDINQEKTVLEEQGTGDLSTYKFEEEIQPPGDTEAFSNSEELDPSIVNHEAVTEKSDEKANDNIVDDIFLENDPKEENKFIEKENLLYLILKQNLPNVKIINDYAIKKITFSYYLPELNLVIDKYEPDKKDSIWKDFYCRQNDLIYMKLDLNENNSLKQLTRNLKRNFAATINKNAEVGSL